MYTTRCEFTALDHGSAEPEARSVGPWERQAQEGESFVCLETRTGTGAHQPASCA